MAIYYQNIVQRSESWESLRRGLPTSSEFKRIVTPTGKLSAQADSYMDILLAEWWFGGPLEDPESDYRSAFMERGVFLESQARQSYEFECDCTVEQCGFVTTDSGLIGASPDGLVGDTHGVELKVPSPRIHLGYMRTGKIEQDYRPQLQGLMLVCERKFWDLQSFCPPFPTVILRVERDDAYHELLSTALAQFVERMLAAREKLIEKYGQPKWKEQVAQTIYP